MTISPETPEAQKAAAAAGVSDNIGLSFKPTLGSPQEEKSKIAVQNAPALETETGGPNYQLKAADYIMRKLKANGAVGTMAYGGYFAEEYLPEWKGRNGIMMADEMRRGDYQVQAVLAHIRNKLLAVNFDWNPADSDDPQAVKHAEFLRHAFFKAPSKTWTYNLKDMYSCLWSGFALFEPTFKVEEGQMWKGKWVIKDFGWRNPKTIWQWFIVDNKLWCVRQISYGDDQRYVDIPGNELVCISVGREGNNYEGISLLRSSWGPFCRKQVAYVVNMIGIERSLGVVHVTRPGSKIGTPIEAKLKQDLDNFTSGNCPWLITPEGWPMDVKEIKYNATAVMDGIRLEDANIAKSVQAEFIEVGMTSQGARAAIEPKIEHFDIALKYLVRLVLDAWQELGEKLIKLNFGEQDAYPTFTGTGLDISMSLDLANSLKDLSDAGGWTWDYETRMWVRKIWGAPVISREDDDAAAQKALEAKQGPPAGQPGGDEGKSWQQEHEEHKGTFTALAKAATAGGKRTSSQDIAKQVAADHAKQKPAGGSAGPVPGGKAASPKPDDKKELHECACGRTHEFGGPGSGRHKEGGELIKYSGKWYALAAIKGFEDQIKVSHVERERAAIKQRIEGIKAREGITDDDIKGFALNEKRTVLTEYEKKIDFAEMKKRFAGMSAAFNDVVRGDLRKTLAKYKVDLKNALAHAMTEAAKYSAINNTELTEGSGRQEDDIAKFMTDAIKYGKHTAHMEIAGKKLPLHEFVDDPGPGLVGWVKATSATITKIQRADLEKKAKFAALKDLQANAGDDAIVFNASEAADEWLDDDRNLGGAMVAQNAVNEGRWEMFQELADELQGLQFSAMMENSCPLCESLDGKTFKIDDPNDMELDPPLHPQCECILVPILLEEETPEWTGRRGEGKDAVDQEDVDKYQSLVEVVFNAGHRS